MGNPGIRKAMTIEQIFFKNQKERRLYELREKAARDELSMIVGAKAEGKMEGRTEGMVDSICKYLDARFKDQSLSLQLEVKKINDLNILDKIYNANSFNEALVVLKEAMKN